MNADHKPASVLEPLLDRVRVLNESRSATQARDYRDEQAAHALLADVGQLVTELQAGHVMDAAELPAPAAEQPTAGCDEMINLLDTVATAALISRSSLGTRAASRIRRRTPPDRIAEILRRRDRPAAEDRQPDQPGIPAATSAPEDIPADPGDMPCGDVLASVYEYLDGDLPDEDGEKVRQHLGTCGSCLREYGLEEAVRRLVIKHCGCDPAPADLRAKVLVRIRQITAAVPAP